MGASWWKLKDGTWGLKGMGLEEGQTVEVFNKQRQRQEVRVGQILHRDKHGMVIARKA